MAPDTHITPAGIADDIVETPVASRRDFVAAAVTLAAATGAAETAEAQTPTMRFINPQSMSKPAAYSHIVEVTGPNRTIYLAGQTGADANGQTSPDFRTQVVQVYENIKTALAAVGATFENVVKTNNYLTNVATQGPILREVRDRYLNKNGLPASTTVQVVALANPANLIEVEVVAVLPLKA